MRWADCPTKWRFDSKGFSIYGAEHETYSDAPEDGFLYIGVRGYAASDYTLKMECDG